MEILIHIGYFLGLVSYSVHDIFWLRLLLVSSYTCIMWGTLLPKGDPPVNVYWMGLFIVVNLIRIYLLYRERQPVPMAEDEKFVYDQAFPNWRPRDFKRLMELAHWREKENGEILIREGEKLEHLFFIYSGQAEIQRSRQQIGQVRRGQFLGEMGFLTEKPASAEVIVTEKLRYVEWSHRGLEYFFEKKPQLKVDIHAAIGSDLIRKLVVPNTFVSQEASAVLH
mgnify:CR=1 FL=1